jgi:hypothetical protein
MGRDQSESVFAFVSEVDEWLESTSAARARNVQHRDARLESPVFYVPSPDPPVARVEPGLPSGPALQDLPCQPVSATASQAAAFQAPRSQTPWIWGLSIAVVMLLALGTWRETTFHRTIPALPVYGAPAAWHVDVDTLVVLDAAGSPVWTHRFAFPLDVASYATPSLSDRMGGVLDLDGDGKREVWFVTRPQTRADRGHRKLHLFNADGSLRWVFVFDGSVVFGSKTYTAWNLDYVFQIPEPDGSGRSALWVVSKERTEYPSVLHRLDVRTGEATSEYWSNGYIEEVVAGTWHSKPVLFLGSCNNDMQGSSLAVLDQTNANGAAPSIRAAYRCTSCQVGGPLAFLVLPKPRRLSALSAAGCVETIEATAGGQLTIMSSHADAGTDLTARGIYRFDKDLELTSVASGDNYDAAFRALVRAGAVPTFSPAAVSPEREFAPILRWTGKGFAPAELVQPRVQAQKR